ncbi:MAG: radical SAM protein [Clostridia bacterium]
MESFICNQCPRRCGALRGQESPGAGAGACRMGARASVARMALHFDEEPCISGKEGSGAVFFSGCALRCVFCQNEAISHGCFGAEISDEQLRAGFERLIGDGANNINLVNPTHFGHVLGRVLGDLPVPVIWNSGGYELPETLKGFEGKVDVYLPDLKYIDPISARRYSGAPDYFAFAAPALKEMLRQVGGVKLDERGIIKRGLIVRHLILPGRARESMRVLDWIAENLPGAWVSLMAQYMPFAQAEKYPEINRRITQEEYDLVADHLLELGLEDGYVQELGASDEKYLPAFDLTGVTTP